MASGSASNSAAKRPTSQARMLSSVRTLPVVIAAGIGLTSLSITFHPSCCPASPRRQQGRPSSVLHFPQSAFEKRLAARAALVLPARCLGNAGRFQQQDFSNLGFVLLRHGPANRLQD